MTSFDRGYLDTCEKCKAVGVIWDALYDGLDASQRVKSIEDMMRDMLVASQQGGDQVLLLQQKLALALTRVYTAWHLVSANVDSIQLRKDAAKDLADLLESSFGKIYSVLASKCVKKQNVFAWFNPSLYARVVTKKIHFCLTAGWIIQKNHAGSES